MFYWTTQPVVDTLFFPFLANKQITLGRKTHHRVDKKYSFPEMTKRAPEFDFFFFSPQTEADLSKPKRTLHQGQMLSVAVWRQNNIKKGVLVAQLKEASWLINEDFILFSLIKSTTGLGFLEGMRIAHHFHARVLNLTPLNDKQEWSHSHLSPSAQKISWGWLSATTTANLSSVGVKLTVLWSLLCSKSFCCGSHLKLSSKC